MATRTTFRENALRIIAVIGLIAVLLLGAWGIIQIAFYIPTFFANLGSGSAGNTTAKETLTVAVPLAVTSGQPVNVAWTHKNSSGNYSYAINYTCTEGLSFKTLLPTGAWQNVACNTPFNYVNAASTTPLVPVLTGTKAAMVNITVTATKLSSGAVTATGTAGTTVNPEKKTTTTTTTTKPTTKPTTTTKPKTTTSSNTTTKYYSSGRTSNLYGSADLAVRIISAPQGVNVGQQVTLQFEVTNVGTNVSASNWSFVASLPFTPVYSYASQGQQALYPGDRIVYTLGYNAAPVDGTNGYDNYNGGYGYDQSGWSYSGASCYGSPECYTGGNQYYGNQYGSGQVTASIQVDPYNQLYETNKANNYAAVSYQVY